MTGGELVLSLLLISLLEKIALKGWEACYNIFKEIKIYKP